MRVSRRRRIALAAVSVAVALGATACAPTGDPGAVAAVIKGLDNTFFQAMRDGITQTAGELGVPVTVQAADSTADTNGQLDKLNALAAQRQGCFLVNPISGNNLIQGLRQVSEAGVPIVNIDQPLDPTALAAAGIVPKAYVGTDNRDAGRRAADEMKRRLGGTGTVAVIGGVAGDVTSNDRVEGFRQAADGLTVLPVVAADWSRQQALTVAADLMTAHPDLKGIFTANDDMALGAARAVLNAHRSGLSVIGVDGTQDALRAVERGELSATVAQYPFEIGRLGMQACKAAMAGTPMPSTIVSPVAVVTSSNVDAALTAFPEPFEPFASPFAEHP